jgi:hypothetical protein
LSKGGNEAGHRKHCSCSHINQTEGLMSIHTSSTARRIAAVAAALVGVGGLAGALVAPVASAGTRTQIMAGTFQGVAFSGPGCTSPVNLCSDGSIHGFLNGPQELVVQSFTATPTPNVSVIDSTVVIHDSRGDVACKEDIAYNATPGGDGEFGGLCEITGGTGHWAGATGYLQIVGTFPPGQPKSSGLYVGKNSGR